MGDGFPFLAALSGNPDKFCIAIDDPAAPRREQFLRRFEALRAEGHELLSVDYRVFLARPRTIPIGFCVVRGQRGQRFARALQACEPHLAENAVVLVDNCNQADLRNAGLQFMRASRNQYRVLLDRLAPHHGALTFGDGLLLFQLLGRNTAVARQAEKPTAPLSFPPLDRASLH